MHATAGGTRQGGRPNQGAGESLRCRLPLTGTACRATRGRLMTLEDDDRCGSRAACARLTESVSRALRRQPREWVGEILASAHFRIRDSSRGIRKLYEGLEIVRIVEV